MTKELVRKEYKKALLKKSGFNIRDKLAETKILKLLESKKGLKPRKLKVLLYLNLPHEVSLYSLIKHLRFNHKDYEVYVPSLISPLISKKTQAKSFKVVKLRLPLKKGHFNIKEPKARVPFFFKDARMDVLVVPVLGVDKSYKRIGFGKGMYDIFYSLQNPKPYLIFVSRIRNVSRLNVGLKHDIYSKDYIWSN
ncbi:hypothetical protein BKH43_07135 [Helicobacter sp. 13S00401-1]|uniref:5-formyltetrahydrofolate cyclo-ligase n=1 Tax=Helicobacter sp. 13S00401-1 TaxID=1905758 RepID=UPI000BA57328|nr:5-formyltetrahydrofolate cyclo-ligase [Helicobacter sp. 13S00401-1]PAF49292.1 hypothetical protein BKH43_07135 [Helicobacter sp. 13S00401-1]